MRRAFGFKSFDSSDVETLAQHVLACLWRRCPFAQKSEHSHLIASPAGVVSLQPSVWYVESAGLACVFWQAEEEAQHLSGSVRPLRIRVGTAGVPASPRVSRAM